MDDLLSFGESIFGEKVAYDKFRKGSEYVVKDIEAPGLRGSKHFSTDVEHLPDTSPFGKLFEYKLPEIPPLPDRRISIIPKTVEVENASIQNFMPIEDPIQNLDENFQEMSVNGKVARSNAKRIFQIPVIFKPTTLDNEGDLLQSIHASISQSSLRRSHIHESISRSSLQRSHDSIKSASTFQDDPSHKNRNIDTVLLPRLGRRQMDGDDSSFESFHSLEEACE